MVLSRALLVLVLTAPVAWSKTEQRVEEKFAVNPGAKLIVEVDSGMVDLARGEEGKITVQAYRKIEGKSEAREKEFIAATPILFLKEANTVVLRTLHNCQNHLDHLNVEARYTIRAPAELIARLKSGGGEITAADLSGRFHVVTGGGELRFMRMHGPLTANSGGGGIVVEDCEGALGVTTGGGIIKATNSKGSLCATTSGGSIDVKNFDGDARVETSGGAISLENVKGSLESETSGGSISANVPRPFPGNVKLETAAGAIVVAIPADAGLDISAMTSEGIVTSEVPVAARQTRREVLEGTINGGGKALTLRTGSGNISIKSAGPLQ